MFAVMPLAQGSPLCRKLKKTGPAIDRWELLDLVKEVSAAYGLRERDITVLHAHLSVLEQGPLVPGAINMSYMKVKKIHLRANVMEARRLCRAETHLEELCFIKRNLSPNGRRYPLKHKGKVVDAYGIDLNPLLERVDELRAVREKMIHHNEISRIYSIKIKERLHQLRHSLSEASLSIQESLASVAAEVRKIIRRKSTGPKELEELMAQLVSFEKSLVEAPCPAESATNASEDSAVMPDKDAACDGQSVRHSKSIPKESKYDFRQSEARELVKTVSWRKELDRGDNRDELVKKECTEGQRCSIEASHMDFKPGRIAALWSTTASFLLMYPEAPRSAHQLYNLLVEYASHFRIDSQSLAEALAILGWERIIVAFDYLTEKVQNIRNPYGYFKSMLNAFRRGETIAGGRVSPPSLSGHHAAV